MALAKFFKNLFKRLIKGKKSKTRRKATRKKKSSSRARPKTQRRLKPRSGTRPKTGRKPKPKRKALRRVKPRAKTRRRPKPKVKPKVRAKTRPKSRKAPKKTVKPPAKDIGSVTHYFDRIAVAVVIFKKAVKVGDRIRFVSGGEEFVQMVMSMQIDRQDIVKAPRGAQVGLKVGRPLKPGDKVYFVAGG